MRVGVGVGVGVRVRFGLGLGCGWGLHVALQWFGQSRISPVWAQESKKPFWTSSKPCLNRVREGEGEETVLLPHTTSATVRVRGGLEIRVRG